MLVEIVAHFIDSGKNYEPSATPIDAPEAKAQQWIKGRWAIPVTIEKAVIETPEDHSEASNRETAALKRKAATTLAADEKEADAEGMRQTKK